MLNKRTKKLFSYWYDLPIESCFNCYAIYSAGFWAFEKFLDLMPRSITRTEIWITANCKSTRNLHILQLFCGHLGPATIAAGTSDGDWEKPGATRPP
jgi:hypothetical protein